MTSINLRLAVFAVLACAMASCGSKLMMVTSGNENLQALTKITDNAKTTAVNVGGSYTSPTLFLAINEGGKTNIFKKENPLSNALTQVTSGDNYNIQPAYSPGNERCAFCYATKTGNGSRSFYDIYMTDAVKGAGLIPVTQTSNLNEWSPSFDNSGRILVYQSNNGINGEIWKKDLQTNEVMLLGNGFSPKVSPDGKRVVFCKYKTNENGPSSIWTMEIDGTNAIQLTPNTQAKDFEPCWSPDGRRIVYSSVSSGKKKDRDLFVINADGTNMIQLTTNKSYDAAPYWSPDGNIYFISDRGSAPGKYQVWRFSMR